MSRVFVAMSGGVDSSVAAALLVEEGHDVVGITMQLWPAEDRPGGCCSVSAVRDARRVCDVLGIPHYALNFRDTFEREVAGPFVEAYASGRTPNPCVACNDRVKFNDLLARVLTQEADFLATGHYARIVQRNGEPWLARGADADKDQSYFLYRMTRSHLERVLFPLGGLTKARVREIARERGLPTAEKDESQEICFVPDDDYAAYVRERYPQTLRPGPIVDTDGRVLGRHKGIAYFTVGQRRGLHLGGRGPYYVVALRPEDDAVVVGGPEELLALEVVAEDCVWHGAVSRSQRIEAQVRYRAPATPGDATFDGTLLDVHLDRPVRGVAPGQAVVCYLGGLVAGGGVVREARR